MIAPRPLLPSDLAPGDQRSAGFSWEALRIIEASHADDPDFERLYQLLEAEFGAKNEIETRAVLRERLAWQIQEAHDDIHLRYHLLGIEMDGHIVAVRDHIVMVQTHPVPGTTVLLSHALVLPEMRRTGLAGWLRAFPLHDVRECHRKLHLTNPPPPNLIAEMEPLSSPEQLPRLKAYARAGFRRVQPEIIPYHQPDFRPFAEIDASGGPQPLPFWLMIRRIGREDEVLCRSSEIRSSVRHFYTMYGQIFRRKDMASLWQALDNYPPCETDIPLEDISFLET